MAYSGLGTGTEIDPYQISTIDQWFEMSDPTYGATVHFKLMNNIDLRNFSSKFRSIILYANIDGGGFTVETDMINDSWFIDIRSNETYIKNLKVISYNSQNSRRVFEQQAGLRTGLILENLDFDLRLENSSINDTFLLPNTYGSFIYGNRDVTSSISNIKIKGPIARIFDGSLYCDVDNIHIILTGSIIIGNFLLANQVRTSMTNCSVSCGTIKLDGAGIFCSTLYASATIDKCRFNGNIEGFDSTVFARTVYAGSTISNCYFNGSMQDNSYTPDSIGLNIFNRLGNATYSCTNNYANIKNHTLEIFNAASSDYYFDNLGFTDWYIPSETEMGYIRDYSLYSNVSSDLVFTGNRTWRLFATSTEVDANNIRTWQEVYNMQTKSKNEYLALWLVRRFTYTDDVEPVVGKKYLGGWCIYKNTETKDALMCTYKPVADGAQIFKFGSTGSFLGTTDGVGAGATNTVLIEAARTVNEGLTNYLNYEYPTISAINTYLIVGTTTGILSNNYYTVDEYQTSRINKNSYLDWVNELSESEIRDVSSFVSWDFVDTWEQKSIETLPTLQDNTEEINIIGVFKKTDVKNISAKIQLNSDLVSDTSIGLIVLDDEDNQLYKQIGLTHDIILPLEKDYNLIFITYYSDETLSDIISLTFSRVFYSYYDVEVTYIQNQGAVTFNIATLGYDSKLIHGSLFYNGYIYGSSRDDGRILKINENNTSDVDYVIPLSPSEGAVSLDQIVLCNGFLWGVCNNILVRIDPNTLEYDSTLLSNSDSDLSSTSVIASSHNKYLYIPGQRYITSYDSSLLVGDTILANIPSGNIDTVIVGSYDSYTQGGYLEYIGEPLYTGKVKGLVHSMVVDGINIYAAYTTYKDSAVELDIDSVSGYSDVLGLSIHELHKIDIETMSAQGWTYIPKSTDDMTQNETHIFLSVELGYYSKEEALGYNYTISVVKKSNVEFVALKKHTSVMSLPQFASYGVFIFGNYLYDVRLDKRIYAIDISDVDNWSTDDPIMKRVVASFEIFPAFSSGVINEIVRGTNGKLFLFLWAADAGGTYPSSITYIRLPNALNLESIPIVQTISAIEE